MLIRRLETLEEYQAVERIEREAWAIADPRDLVPLHVLLTAQKNGGLVAGAFDQDGQMLGFVFGFLGMAPDGRLKHCSHMAAVLPSAQGRAIGYRLKLFQREEVLKQGIELITWTYDPLQRVNAWLNISKLGAAARIYHHNLYGMMTSGLNAGVPSDRFEVEWWLQSDAVRARLEGRCRLPRLAELLAEGASFALQGVESTEGFVPQALPHQAPHEVYLVEIPFDFNALRDESLALARAWRRESGRVLSGLFARGYVLREFLCEDGRAVYVLRR